MRSIIKSISFVLIMFFFAAGLEAQSGFGPHGGRLKTVDAYKIEVSGCDNYVEIYLFDSDTNAINNDHISGQVEFVYANEAVLISPLIHYGMDGFTAKIPKDTFLYSKPSLTVNGTFIVTEKFENECLMSADRN